MSKRDEGHNPFGWVVLGFILGVVATLGALIFLSGGPDETPEAFDTGITSDAEPGERRESPADGAFGSGSAPFEAPEVGGSEPPVNAPVAAPFGDPLPPPLYAPPADPNAAPATRAPAPARRPAASVDDSQIAEDAAAAGMTARSPRN